ncbi:acyl-protein thioesterase-1-like protein [Zalerion maritima]|uniref:Acyl-protein thioesterase 1 n=1 Tax=Zalerion maritima TaxID=339359 RepID=A0AAD5WV67_9PEZI|nr:acyl-protein thioesterase-1-like protein [Zalerion maritima]
MASGASKLVSNAISKHTATVIFVHGLGDTGNGWMFLVENFRRRQLFPEVKFILPTAPIIPITCNWGFRMNGWYDIAVLDGAPETLRENEDKPGILRSQAFFHSLIQEEIDAGIPGDRIILGGFSQGGAMSLFSGLTAPVKLAGIIGLSCYLLLSKTFKDILPKESLNKDTPIFMAHGDADGTVNPKVGELSKNMLQEMDFKVDWKTYSGMGHEACPEEINDVQAFIEKHLPPQEKSEL